MPSVSSAQPLQEAVVSGSCWVHSPMGLRNWKASISSSCAGPAPCDLESAWHPAVPSHNRDSLHSWQMCASTAFKGWVCRMGKLPSVNPVWTKGTKHTGTQVLCIPIACCSPRLQKTEGDPSDDNSGHQLWSICSSVTWEISGDLVLIFCLASSSSHVIH